MDLPFWGDKRRFSRAEAWIDLLLRADESRKVTVTRRQLAAAWGWPDATVKYFVNMLVRLGMVEKMIDPHFTQLTIRDRRGIATGLPSIDPHGESIDPDSTHLNVRPTSENGTDLPTIHPVDNGTQLANSRHNEPTPCNYGRKGENNGIDPRSTHQTQRNDSGIATDSPTIHPATEAAPARLTQLSARNDDAMPTDLPSNGCTEALGGDPNNIIKESFYDSLEFLKNKKYKYAQSRNDDSAPNSDTADAVVEIPLIKRDGVFVVTQRDIDEWQDTFPAIDVLAELKRLRQWNIANPDRRKTARGIRRHIVQWLGRAQDRSGGKPKPGSANGHSTSGSGPIYKPLD